MAKFGKRAKKANRDVTDPRMMFGAPPLPRHSGPPASSTPLADYLARGWPGVDQGYVVLPRSLAEAMSLPWQQQMVNQLAQFHEAHAGLSWPIYKVVPSRYEKLVDLDEEQLAEAGYLVEIDADGDMVYRERSGRRVEQPEDTTVLVPCLDPIARRPAQEEPRPGQAGPPSGPVPPAQRAPVPMNIGPQPVWSTTPKQSAPKQNAPVSTPPGGTPAPSAPPVPPVNPPTPAAGTPAPAPATPAPTASPATPPSGIPATPAAPESVAGPAHVVDPAAQAPAEATDTGAPAPGTVAARGWFDELPDGEQPDAGQTDGAAPGDFGPTGEPTEVPYRYRR
jgi:hypothetical protein